MTAFTIHTPDTAPSKAGQMLAEKQRQMGFLPNLYAIFADSEPVLEGYLTLSDLVTKTSFTPAEQQLILLTVSVENGCRYCVAAHSSGARMAGLDKSVIEALRTGTEISDQRLEVLRSFVEAIVRNRGHAKAEMEAFLAAGFDRRQALEAVMCVAMKTFSNYANHLIDTPLDGMLRKTAWDGKPARNT